MTVNRLKNILIILPLFLVSSCQSVKEFHRLYTLPEGGNYQPSHFDYDSTKKTIAIIADHEVTELFDLIAPYYLFSATEKTNTFIISKHKQPICLFKGLFVMPHLTFDEFEQANIKADAIIIPNISAMKANDQDSVIIQWIRNNYDGSTNILSICSGASTAAATGIFYQQDLTTHASDYQTIKKEYPAPNWVTNVSVTQSNNVYSTAGVSNAVEGSLLLIKNLLNDSSMQLAKSSINYPHKDLQLAHKSEKIRLKHMLRIVKKSLFGKNQNINVFLYQGIDEFKLAAILDTYNRTFPKSINSFSSHDQIIQSKFGLTLIPTQYLQELTKGETHIIDPSVNLNSLPYSLQTSDVVHYSKNHDYIFEKCLNRIEKEHGSKFKEVVKLLLDYN